MMPKIAVLIPCFQEQETVGKVVRDFRRVLPQAAIYVYDNNSTDRTADLAREAGAIVRHERHQGKGYVVRRMFRDIDADFYVIVDGDGTYDAHAAPEMIALAWNGPVDLVNCVRHDLDKTAFRRGHRFGNKLLTGAVRRIFGNQVRDILSGYKCLSRRFVKSFPALARGFDIEAEMTIHALECSMPVGHVHGLYRGRSEGSTSKLRTVRDGCLILGMITRLVRHERPLLFFGFLAVDLALGSLIIATPIFVTYFETGLVPRLPSAVLSASGVLLSALLLVAGVILDTVSRGRSEVRLLAYLQHPKFPMADEMDADQKTLMQNIA